MRVDALARRRQRICVVTPGYLASTPRVVREADALAAAGYDVRVAHTQGPIEDLRAIDARLVRERAWRATAFGWSNRRPDERLAFFGTGIRHRLARALPEALATMAGVTERAEGRMYPELAALAAAEAADLYIGHYPTGLAAAARAAARTGAQLGYDAEDLYSETFPDSPEWTRTKARILQLEGRHVPGCASVTAASEPIASVIAERFQRPVLAVHNCHPWSARARMDGAVRERRGSHLSLFWFSQTVGLDRGLQEAIRALGLMQRPVQLHLRGYADASTRRTLQQLAADCGVGGAVHFHPPCHPDELLARAAEHDVGLALETDAILNRRLTVTNKLFLYLTAGLAVAATDVPGQRSVLETCPHAGQLYGCNDVQALAGILSRWADDATSLAAAKLAALEAARTRWNAEAEGERLVASIDAVLCRAESARKASGE